MWRRWATVWAIGLLGIGALAGCSSLEASGDTKATPSSAPTSPHGSSGAAHFDDFALVAGDGDIDVQAWVDPLCPDCKAFEEGAGDVLSDLVADGTITYSIHPMNFLDRNSAGSKYSTRAGSALTCVAVAHPDLLLDAVQSIFDAQPKQGTTGLSDQAIIDTLAATGADSIDDCVKETTYADWVQLSNDRAIEGIEDADIESIDGTPTLVVEGWAFRGDMTDGEAVRAFILSAAT